MTALSMAVRADAAYLIADTGSYHHDGTIMGFGEKIILHPTLPIAMGSTGIASSCTRALTQEWLAAQRSAQEAIKALPELTHSLLDDVADIDETERLDTCGDIPLWIGVALVAFDAAAGRPEGRLCASGSGRWGAAWPPFAVSRTATMFQPSVGDLWPELAFDPERDARELISLQRKQPDENGEFRVGGEAHLVRVDASGATMRTIARWPEDRVGKRVGEPSTRWERLKSTMGVDS